MSPQVWEWSPDSVFPVVYCTSFQRTWGMKDEPATTYFSHSISGLYGLHGSSEGRIRVQEASSAHQPPDGAE